MLTFTIGPLTCLFCAVLYQYGKELRNPPHQTFNRAPGEPPCPPSH